MQHPIVKPATATEDHELGEVTVEVKMVVDVIIGIVMAVDITVLAVLAICGIQKSGIPAKLIMLQLLVRH